MQLLILKTFSGKTKTKPLTPSGQAQISKIIQFVRQTYTQKSEVTHGYLHLIRILKSLPKEDHKPHLHNTQWMYRHVSLRHMYHLCPTSTCNDKAPLFQCSFLNQRNPFALAWRVTALEVTLRLSDLLQIKFTLCNKSTWCSFHL